MHSNIQVRIARPLIVLLVVICSLVSAASAEWKEKMLYSFQGGPYGHDGDEPAGGVVFDKAGNVYGATWYGGSSGCGTAYRLAPPAQKITRWTETLLHVFNGPDGCYPSGGLIADGAGNFYGVTGEGGIISCLHVGCGAVYELSPPTQKGGAWTETVRYRFQGGQDGVFPYGALVFDSVGNLYGATLLGGGKGTTCNPGYGGCGTVFELSPPKAKDGKWTEKVLHRFAGIASGKNYGDGAEPNGGLVLDSEGALYGTTQIGGAHVCGSDGCGTAFALTPPTKKGEAWREKILHRFGLAGNDGYFPIDSPLIVDAKGSLYGTTVSGGSGSCVAGCGTVYQLTPAKSGVWIEALLYSFQGAADGEAPVAPVTLDGSGNLYGTAGGDGGIDSWGTVFKLAPPAENAPEWSLTVLHSFTGPPDGASPAAPLMFRAGAVFSTTTQGGTGRSCKGNCGTLFKIWPQ
ncbi:MAG: choice-of-anchor tandem repeat GloVer-containing protein [Terriglobales bacterium]